MDTRDLVRVAVAAAATACGAAKAQLPEPALSDVNLPPAEDRDSVGAVVFETSMVRAQRDAFGVRDTPARVAAIGREVMRLTRAQQLKEELARRREDEAIQPEGMGAGGEAVPR